MQKQLATFRNLFVSLLTIVLLVTACGQPPVTAPPATDTPAAAAEPRATTVATVQPATAGPAAAGDTTMLEGIEWLLSTYSDGQGGQQPALVDAPATISFSDGSFSGSTGCNRYSGGYSSSNGELTLSQVATTQMACPPPIMDQEQQFLQLLNQVTGYGITDDELTLTGADGSALLVFNVLEPAALIDTVWNLTAFNNGRGALESVAATSEATAIFGADGRLVGNGGCNRYMADYSVDGDSLTITAPASTRRACPEPLMSQETAFLAALETVASYSIQGDTLDLFQTDGARAASFTAAPPETADR